MGRVGATAVPPIQYAQSVGARIAYQVIGDGPVTIVGIPPFAQNIEIMWERPEFARMFERMATFARVVHFDKRGTGMSDRTPMPTLDERVDDTRAVMDAAGIERAVLHGVSEGGPLAILFARTYPERVSSLILHGTAARFVGDETPAERDQRRAWEALFARVWGTDDSFTLRVLAPSVTDPSYVVWEPRYERQSATPPDLAELLALRGDIDVTALLPHLTVPTLVIHRTGDVVVPVEHGRELAAAIPNARLAEVEGIDHFAHIGDTDSWLDIVEEFVTGTPVMATARPRRPPSVTEIRMFGGFAVVRDGEPVRTSAWGSRRARQLCKRLAVAAGAGVAREQLIDLLWPDEADSESYGRLGARLSVQLSTVRRILGGGVIADRESIRLDGGAVHVDLAEFNDAIAAGRFGDAVALRRGELLPEDLYEDWVTPVRDRARLDFATAVRALLPEASAAGALPLALRWLEVDEYDQDAHRAVIGALRALGREREAALAADSYRARMEELGS